MPNNNQKKQNVISVFRGNSERPSRVFLSNSWHDDLCALLNPIPRFGRWSPIVWKKDESRISGAFDFCDFLVLDFDGELSLESALKRLKDKDFLVLATKSHGVPQKKQAVVLDRFRVIIPFAERVKNLADFYATMRSAGDLFPEADRKCLDAARFYWTRGKGELGRGYGEKFEIKRGTDIDEKKAFIETFGADQSELKGFNLTNERICVIKAGGFGSLRFDFQDSRSTSLQSPNYSKRAKKPFRLGRRESPSHWWSPAKKPVFEKIKTTNSQGKTTFRAGKFLREEWRVRGLLAFEIDGKVSKKITFLRGVVTRHPFGHRLWIAYDLSKPGGQAKTSLTHFGENTDGGIQNASITIDAQTEEIKKNLIELFTAMGLYGSIKADSWDFGRKIPLVPSEIQRLRDFDFSGRFITPKDERILKKIEELKNKHPELPPTNPVDTDQGTFDVSNSSCVSNGLLVSSDSISQLADIIPIPTGKPIIPGHKERSKSDRMAKVKTQELNQPMISDEGLGYDTSLTGKVSRIDAGSTPLLRNFWKNRRELNMILGHPKLCCDVSLEGTTLTVRSSPLRISSKKIALSIMGSQIVEAGVNPPKIQSMERSVRRLVNSLVERGYFVTFDPYYVPGRRGRILCPTKKLFEELFYGGMLVGENMERLTPRAGVDVILNLDESTPADLGEPSDGKFNEWIWRAAWKFSTRRDFFSWLHENYGGFIAAKSDRERQAENAWKRRQTLSKKHQ